jgi:streptogramin lyase
MRPSRTLPLLLAGLVLPLAGCSLANTAAPSSGEGVASIAGNVHGGQQPISQAHVHLLGVSSAGYGAASQSLIASGYAGTDSIGPYVLTNANGDFALTGDYTCTAGQEVYVYATGGNPGGGTNADAGLLAPVGTCQTAPTLLEGASFVTVNELSTVAFAYAMAGFTVDPTHVASSASTLGQLGLANAFATIPSLYTGSASSAPTTTAAGNGTVPYKELNTLANILAACINSTSPFTSCNTLFTNATTGGTGGTQPADTAVAAINIAHNPALVGISNLFPLQTAATPFQPGLTSAPSDFSVAISYTGGGLVTPNAQEQGTSSSTQPTLYNDIAVDATGNIWKSNFSGNNLTELSPLGVPLSGTNGFAKSEESEPANIAIDPNGYLWIPSFATSFLGEYYPTGLFAQGFNSPTAAPQNLAIDASGNVFLVYDNALAKFSSAGGLPGTYANSLSFPVGIAFTAGAAGNVWVANLGGGGGQISVYTNSGGVLQGSPYAGSDVNIPSSIAFDASGNAWLANLTSFGELTGSGAEAANYTVPNASSLSHAIPGAIAVDGTGKVWATDTGPNCAILATNNSGKFLSGTNGFQAGETTKPQSLAIDPSGNLWYSAFNDATIHELVGIASPTVTPLSVAVKNSTLGTRP